MPNLTILAVIGKFSKLALKFFTRVPSRFWSSFLFASALAMSLELVSERIVESGQSTSWTQSIFTMTGLYQWIVASPRKPVPRYAEIVTIDPISEKHSIPSSNNVCAQREFLGRLIQRIAVASPDVIVIDKDFLPSECDWNANKVLLTTIVQVTRTIPVVVGRTLVESPHGGFEEKESLQFGFADPALFFEGVASLDPDSRRLPLAWHSGGSVDWESIALKTARAHDPNFVSARPKLQKLLYGQPPFLSFMTGFDQHSSLDVLCGSLLQEAPTWRSCVKENPSPTELIAIARQLKYLRSRIVVIGEVSDEDMHESLIGTVPGFLLQANFIEALLDDRYFAPACWADYVFGFIVFMLLELILAREGPTRIALFQGALLFCAAVIFLYLIILVTQTYVNPVAIGVTTLVVKLGTFISDKIQGKHIRKALPSGSIRRSIAYISATIALISVWAVFCPGPRRIKGRAVTMGGPLPYKRLVI